MQYSLAGLLLENLTYTLGLASDLPSLLNTSSLQPEGPEFMSPLPGMAHKPRYGLMRTEAGHEPSRGRQPQMTEFLGQGRCRGCQDRDFTCLLQHEADRCTFCATFDQPCIFSRVIRRTAERSAFSIDELLESQCESESGRSDQSQYSPFLSSQGMPPPYHHAPQKSIGNHLIDIRGRSPQKSHTDTFVGNGGSLLNSESNFMPNLVYGPQSNTFPFFRKASLGSSPSNSVVHLPPTDKNEQNQESTQFVFESFNHSREGSPKPRKGRKLKRLTDSGKKERAFRRSQGACSECRARKTRVLTSSLPCSLRTTKRLICYSVLTSECKAHGVNEEFHPARHYLPAKCQSKVTAIGSACFQLLRNLLFCHFILHYTVSMTQEKMHKIICPNTMARARKHLWSSPRLREQFHLHRILGLKVVTPDIIDNHHPKDLHEESYKHTMYVHKQYIMFFHLVRLRPIPLETLPTFHVDNKPPIQLKQTTRNRETPVAREITAAGYLVAFEGHEAYGAELKNESGAGDE